MTRLHVAWSLFLVALGLGLGLVGGRSPGLVEWEAARSICIESDDWGLCGFLPDSSAISVLDREALAPGPFPDVYWHSTYEDSAAVARLCAVLAEHRGRDGLPAVMQPNYIMASLAYRPATDQREASWHEASLPQTPPGYERPGLWNAVREARRAGVWHPEFHGRWHYDPERRLAATAGDPIVEAAAARQVLVFPDSERAWELGPWRDPDILSLELDQSLATFRELFGSLPRSVIAPDYLWNDEDEVRWVQRGLRVIQGQRQQRQAGWRWPEGRIKKVVHRTLTRWWRRDRTYLDRNCIFEPVQQEDPRGITRAAVDGVRRAWRRGEPAVLEAHRINFVHLDHAVTELGRAELRVLLSELDHDDPVYLVDAEVAEMQRRGTSWVVRGGRIVVRNFSHSRRLVVIPAEARRSAAVDGGRDHGALAPLVVSLASGETRVLGPGPGAHHHRDDN